MTSQVFPASGFIATLNPNINVYTYNPNSTSFTLKTSFNPFQSFAGGYNIAVVSTAQGGRLVVGAGPGGNPVVAVINPNTLAQTTFNAGTPTNYGGGVVVGSEPIAAASGSTFASGNILTGQAVGSDSTVKIYDGLSFGLLKTVTTLPGDINGVFVAGA